MEGPASYRIRVRGRLEVKWSDRMGGMRISNTFGADGSPETKLEGWLEDQAALEGILNTLYELHFPLLSVDFLDTEP